MAMAVTMTIGRSDRSLGDDDRTLLRHRLGFLGTALVGLLCCALALVAGSAAFSNSFGRRMPALAAQLPPTNGNVLSRLASALAAEAAREAQQTANFAIPDAARELAESALVSEPSLGQAVRTLALYHAALGDENRAEALMLSASRLSRRDSVVNLWLAERSLERGDLEYGIALMDATLRTDTRAASMLLPRMVELLEVPGAEQYYLPMLEADPPWLQDFWSAVLQDQSAPRQVARVRSELLKSGVKIPAGQDALLIKQLVNAQQFEEAVRLYRQVRAEKYGPTVSYAPIDWLMVSAPKYGSSLDAESNQISLSGLPGAEGPIAQRLVRLRQGSYRLTVEVKKNPDRLGAKLVCAEAAGERTFERIFRFSEDETVRFTNDSGCRYAWLTLILLADGQHRDVDLTVDRVQLLHEGAAVRSPTGS